MANQTTPQKTRKLRKATFEKNGDAYKAVNKRAKQYLRLIGKRTKATKDDLKKIAKTGKVKVYVYTDAGVLRKAVA